MQRRRKFLGDTEKKKLEICVSGRKEKKRDTLESKGGEIFYEENERQKFWRLGV